MPKRSSKKKDVNETAFATVRRLAERDEESPKNPAAVALGRLGGLKGGKARAKKLSPKERSRIASLAAVSRWRNEQ